MREGEKRGEELVKRVFSSRVSHEKGAGSFCCVWLVVDCSEHFVLVCTCTAGRQTETGFLPVVQRACLLETKNASKVNPIGYAEGSTSEEKMISIKNRKKKKKKSKGTTLLLLYNTTQRRLLPPLIRLLNEQTSSK